MLKIYLKNMLVYDLIIYTCIVAAFLTDYPLTFGAMALSMVVLGFYNLFDVTKRMRKEQEEQ